MSVRVSKCPSCGRIQYDGLCILSQRLVAVDDSTAKSSKIDGVVYVTTDTR